MQCGTVQSTSCQVLEKNSDKSRFQTASVLFTIATFDGAISSKSQRQSQQSVELVRPTERVNDGHECVNKVTLTLPRIDR